MSESRKPTTEEKATFAAGCFWGVEELYRTHKGVHKTTVGYTGGHKEHPSYEEVCADDTGHAEAVEIVYDPGEVSYEELLNIFWENHDPTTPNRQGPDIGTQYRSVIFYHTPEQQRLAEKSKTARQASDAFRGKTIVTEIVPAETFYPAEEYHQQYLAKRGLGTCHI